MDMRRLQYISILSIVIVFSVIPRLLAGLNDLRRAQSILNPAGSQSASDYLPASDYLSAAEAFRAAALRLPWRADLWEQAGNAAYHAGDPTRARAYFLRAPSLSKENRFLLGEMYWQLEEYDRATAVWEALNADGFESPQLYMRLAQAYRRNGNEEEEFAVLKSLAKLNYDDADLLYRLAVLSTSRADESALSYVNRATTRDPAHWFEYQVLRTALNTAALSDNKAYQLVVAGRALGDVQEWKLAMEALARATQIEPTYAEAWAWLGEAMQQQGLDGGEMVAFAYKLNPKSPMVVVLYALYYQRQENGTEALNLLRQAVDLEPNNPAWWAALASAQAQSGDVTGATDAYQKAVDLAPNDSTYWRLLAAFTANYDHLVQEVGVHAALMAYSLDSNDPANCEIIGLIMLKREQYAAAEYYLLRALALDGERAPANFYMGLLKLQQNDPTQARDFLEKARDLDPAGPIGAQARRILERYFP